MKDDPVLIIGAGVMGTACALALLWAGRAVTLLERALPGAESSAAAAGILGAQSEVAGPGPFQELCLYSRALFPAYAEELVQVSGLGLDYMSHGVLEVAMDPGEGRLVSARAEWMLSRGLRVEMLDPEEALALEPTLSDRMVGANYYPDDHHLDPHRLGRALTAAVQRLGGVFRSSERVLGIESAHGRVTGVQTANGHLPAGQVIVAGGAWSSGLRGLPPLRTPVKPMAGQILVMDTRPPLFRHVVYGLKGYLVPRPDGRILMGSTLEDRGFDKAVTAAGMQRITGMAMEMVPALGQARFLDAWSGLRPATGDGLPLLGVSRQLEGLYFATGHYRNGILLTPATGEVIRDLVLGRTPAVDISTFAP